jgi:biotin operon repressor
VISHADIHDTSRSNSRLARDLGVSKMTIWRRRVQEGLHTPTRRPIDENAVSLLARRGKSDGEIAAVLGCTSQGVQKVRQKLNLAALPRGRRSTR